MGRICVFIDAANVRAVTNANGRRIDWAKMLDYLRVKHGAEDMKVYYYDAYFEHFQRSQEQINKQRSYFTKLEKFYKFNMRLKPLKRIRTDAGFKCPKCHTQSMTCEHCMQRAERGIVEKGNLDTEIVVDIIQGLPEYDEAILFSGDSDFLEAIKIIRKHGKKIHIYSSKGSLSKELRTAGDSCKDIKLIKEDIWDSDFVK